MGFFVDFSEQARFTGTRSLSHLEMMVSELTPGLWRSGSWTWKRDPRAVRKQRGATLQPRCQASRGLSLSPVRPWRRARPVFVETLAFGLGLGRCADSRYHPGFVTMNRNQVDPRHRL